MPPWCIGIHGSNPYKVNTLAMPFYSVIPLRRIPSALLVAKLFYKRECQEKYSPAELEAGENRLAFSPLYRSMAASVVCRVTHPEGSSLLGADAGFTPSLFLLSGCVRQNGPEPSRARRQARRSEPLTARTVLRQSGKRKRRSRRCRFLKTQQAVGMPCANHDSI